jgi:hypothetical protein
MIGIAPSTGGDAIKILIGGGGSHRATSGAAAVTRQSLPQIRKTKNAALLIICGNTRSAMSMGDKAAESAEKSFAHSQMRQERC